MNRIVYLLMISFLVCGCASELDEPKTTTVFEDPEVIDAFFVSSTVYQEFTTLPMAGVEVKFISDAFQAETLTNAEGVFYFEIPTEITEGIVYIYSETYFPVLLKYDQVNEINDVVFLNEDIQQTSGPVTSFNDLFTIEGRIVYPNGSPVSDVILRVNSPSSDNAPGFRLLSLGTFQLGTDGRFSIVGDSLSARPIIEISGESSTERCLSNIFQSITVDMKVIPLGDIVYDRDFEDFVDINISASECMAGLKSKVYFGPQQPLGLFDEDLGDLSVPYCSDFGPELAYVGVEDSEGKSFDGVFISELQDGMSFEFEPCVPAIKFFEMEYQGDSKSYQVQYDTTNQVFLFEDPDISISYSYDPRYSNCNTSSCGEKEFKFTYMEDFQFVNNEDPLQNVSYNTGIFMDNVVDSDTELAGVIMTTDAELKIRFRAEKI